jgi:hypothetical protein
MKKLITTILITTVILFTSMFTIQAAGTSNSQTAIDLENHLKTNFGTIVTDVKTFDVKDNIKVVENTNQYKCFDLAIVVDWYAVEVYYYDIRNSINYTKEQKASVLESLKSYQKSLYDASISLVGDKKIRGGFLDYGYKYPALQMDFYEYDIMGWSNYDYSTHIFPGYYDTNISDFHWIDFSKSDSSGSNPFDNIY